MFSSFCPFLATYSCAVIACMHDMLARKQKEIHNLVELTSSASPSLHALISPPSLIQSPTISTSQPSLTLVLLIFLYPLSTFSVESSCFFLFHLLCIAKGGKYFTILFYTRLFI